MARRPRRVQRSRPSNAQIEAMIVYMEEHTLFARGQIPRLGVQGHIKFKKMWTQLTMQLNLQGPCIKTEKEWQETWKRMRLNAKANKAKFSTALRRTGHNTPSFILEPKDERISNIFGQYGTGINLGKELGFSKSFWKEHYSITSDFCLDAKADTSYDARLTISNDALSIFKEECFHTFQQIIFLWKGKGKTSAKPNSAQLDTMVDYMARHLDLALGKAINEGALWEVLVTMLNGNPRGTTKPKKAWQRTWADLVIAARQNLTFLSEGSRLAPLSDLHCKVLRIVGYEDEQKSCLPATPMVRYQFNTNDAFTTRANKRYKLDSDEPSTSWAEASPLPMSSIYPSSSTPSRSVAATATATTLASPSTAKTLTFTAAATASGAKSSKFLKALDDSFQNFITNVAELLQSSFVEQNAALQDSLRKNNEALLEKLPKIMSQEFIKAIENPLSSTEKEESTAEVPPDTQENEYLVLEKCAICQEPHESPAILECDHIFCYECIVKWVEEAFECPLCRKFASTVDIQKLL